MATSIALAADGRSRRGALPRHLSRRIETLIPVSLRLLDESGRHRIAEPMLGIVIEVAGRELSVSVMGRGGRPLKYGLARQQKVVVSFLATELHEKVESLVCDLQDVAPISGQPDAWQAHLRLPHLLPELAEETITALHRYGRQARRTVSSWTAGGLMLAAGLTVYVLVTWSSGRALSSQVTETDQLRAQLAFSTKTVDQLARSLEEADRALERQRGHLAEVEATREAIAALETENALLTRRLDETRTSVVPKAVQLRGVSLSDFRTMRSIRGAATAPRLRFQNGTLELLPSHPDRRRLARNAGGLVAAFAQSRRKAVQRRASWALESDDGRIGLETQEAFVIGEAPKDRPDFVFETRDVNVGDWLPAYAAVGIQEVWLWRGGRLEIRALGAAGYTSVIRSGLLPDLEPATLARFIAREDQAAATQAFLRAVGPAAPPDRAIAPEPTDPEPPDGVVEVADTEDLDDGVEVADADDPDEGDAEDPNADSDDLR